MNNFIYIPLNKFINDNKDKINEIINQYFSLLSQLTNTPIITNEEFINNLSQISNMGCIIICYTIIENNINIIGSGTIIFEPKIIRNGKNVGHIEDIVVDEKYRSMKIGTNIFNKLIELANERNCYKVILDCTEDVSGFYEKIGFKKHGIQMSKYF
jgi:glucosamine-phosphate N-acetyltransferase